MDSSNIPQFHQVASHYQPYHREAEELTNSFHARLQDPFNPVASMLKHEADELVNDIAANRHPQEVEDRIRSIQAQLRQSSGSDTAIFSYENQAFFQRRYGALRGDLQKLPGYENRQDGRYQPSAQASDGPAQGPPSGWHPFTV